MCGSPHLETFLDLGFTPPADQFLRPDQLQEPETYFPLRVASCQKCGLAQLDHVVSPEILYRRDYPYESSTTKFGQQHWREFATTVTARLGLDSSSLVIDVGSNVGVLLEAFRQQGARVLGIDPASNIVRLAEKRGIETVDEFFAHPVAVKVAEKYGKASLITATNVFAHVHDLRDFIQGVDHLLNPRGVFIFEAPYFGNLVNQVEFDTIYHEHLSYLSLEPIVQFLGEFNMEVFDVQERDIHGGSFRVFVARKGGHPVEAAVQSYLEREKKLKLRETSTLKKFAIAVEDNRRSLMSLLHDLKKTGKKIAGVSAPAKGMTLLNYCRIGPELLDFVTEKSTLKIGRFTPGTHIPVVGDEALVQEKVDYALLLAWNFAEEIMGNLKEFRTRGGKFILPVPVPRVVE
jgi:SAM-dependent methyltransferase